jgi:hypothetical protein
LQLGRFCLLRIFALKPGSAFHLRKDWIECAILMVRRAEITQTDVRLIRNAIRERFGKTGLPDPGLAGNQHHTPTACLRLPLAAEQQVQFLSSADERRGAGTESLEAAKREVLGEHAPSMLRFGEALQGLRPEIRKLEQSANLPACALRYDHAALLSQRLQPRGKIRGIANNRPLMGRTSSQRVPNNHQTSGDPNPNLQALRCLKPAHSVHQCKAGPNGWFSIIFVCLRVAEINQRAVTQILRNKTIETGYSLSDAGVIAADHLTQVLRIEAGGQRRRAN